MALVCHFFSFCKDFSSNTAGTFLHPNGYFYVRCIPVMYNRFTGADVPVDILKGLCLRLFFLKQGNASHLNEILNKK